MQSLLNKKIVLGISGGIAAYKTPELARQLMQEGATVQVVMTEAAGQFVTAVTMQALTGNPVYTSQWDSSISNNMAHIEKARELPTQTLDQSDPLVLSDKNQWCAILPSVLYELK